MATFAFYDEGCLATDKGRFLTSLCEALRGSARSANDGTDGTGTRCARALRDAVSRGDVEVDADAGVIRNAGVLHLLDAFDADAGAALAGALQAVEPAAAGDPPPTPPSVMTADAVIAAVARAPLAL